MPFKEPISIIVRKHLWASLYVMLSFCAPLCVAADDRLVVFVSIPPQQYFVDVIGANHVISKNLIEPGQTAETFEPTPQQLTAIGRAKVFFTIGLPFEQAWVPKLKRNYPELELIDSSAGIVRSEWHTHQHANEHQYFFDPHVWTSPENGLQIARSIAQALVRVDPTHAAEYERNFEQLKARLEAVDTTLRTLLSRRTARRFYVFHPAWGYFATAYGLEQVALEQEGRAPGLRRLKMLIEQARADRVRCIFVQEQYSRKTAQTFADAVNAEIAEADTLAYDYPASLIHFAEQLAGINSETCGAK